jgi:hypothetical protein
MGLPILTPDELSRWLNGDVALYLAHPEQFARQVLELARVLQLDTAVQLAGQGLQGLADQVAGLLQLELHRSLNGGW